MGNKRIGILTAGGDCPGLNAAIRGIGKTAIVEYGMKVYGISDGFSGLIDEDYAELAEKDLSGILTLGGTILGTSREKPFKGVTEDFNKPEIIKENYNKLKLDCLVCIGGNGTMKTAAKLDDYGLNVVGIPKTIDNDVYGTDQTFGFDSAVSIATEALDRLHTTANSHKRIMILQVMGHHAGWIALYAGMAAGGDVILIPELDYDLNVVCDYLTKRAKDDKAYSIVVVAEGIKNKKPKKSAAAYLSSKITKKTGLETRETILGYIQRGGSPTHNDRILATRFGSHAAELIEQGNYGNMVSVKDNILTSIALNDVGGKLRLVETDNSLIQKGKKLGICFGDNF